MAGEQRLRPGGRTQAGRWRPGSVVKLQAERLRECVAEMLQVERLSAEMLQVERLSAGMLQVERLQVERLSAEML